MTHLQTNDLEEVQSVVAGIYCAHSVLTSGGASADAAGLDLIRRAPQPVVKLHYGRSVRIDAGTFPRLMLMQTCLDGSGAAEQGSLRAELRRGQTVPLSPGLATRLAFDSRFAQQSVRLDIERVEALCSSWLNVPALDRPLRFDLNPFSAALEQAWSQAVGLIVSYARSGLLLPASAIANLDEFIVSLVLSQHPHNYSDDLRRPQKGLPPRLVREAERLMRDGELHQTPSKIAAELGVSLRTLELGFRAVHDCSPSEFLRRVRVAKARETLLAPKATTSVTEVALANGFLHLARFSAYYREVFGESPVHTLRRSQPRGTLAMAVG
ncbi:AraC family transcriptional regulator [Dyella terrae]|uniref:AraC family transcriptional regulator n=1 Tax=Dyella terrae TaxID=522259 RepID=UPI001EFE632F|nr:AraC family transcriptional regulator [Dyella terrae]ULU26565.1 AraC family transcriptional regulator [Dyella terrae]